MISKKNKNSITVGKKKQKHQNHSLYDYHLAIKQSDNDVRHKRHLGNWDKIEKDSWHLPGTKEARYDCLQWKTDGCVNEKQHEQNGYGRTAFVKHYQKTCTRADCNKCMDHWINRNSIKATNRILGYSKKTGLPSFHLALSPSKDNQQKPEPELRKEVMNILKKINVKGGALVFHPFNQVPKSNDWKEFPHFHFVGFGWMRLVKEVAKKYGWVVIYLKKRKFIFGTFTYLFSHCGIKKGRHAITWIGDLSYGKLNIPKRPTSNKCPCCNEYLVPVYHAGKDPPFQEKENFEGFVNSLDWYIVKTNPP